MWKSPVSIVHPIADKGHEVKTIFVDPRTDPLWERLVERSRSSVFHSPAWMRVLAETYGFECGAQVILDEAGRPTAGIPFFRIADMIGERMVILPFSDYFDPLIDDLEQWNCLTEKLTGNGCPVAIRCLHNNLPLADDRFTLVDRAKWHGMDLRPDLNTIWNSLHSSARRAIKKAQRNGVVIQIAEHKELLRAFFELHLKVRKYKYHFLTQPYRFFEQIWHHFVEAKNGLLMVATYQNEIVGGVFFLEWKGTLCYKFNASKADQLAFRPNDLLMWEGVIYAKTKGLTYMDFGLSDWDQEGLLRYKRKFATEEKTISFLKYMPDGKPTEQERQMRQLLPHLAKLFTDATVPDYVTERAGEVLYRFFT